MKHRFGYRSYAFGNFNGGQTTAAIERILSNACYGAWNLNGCQACTVRESGVTDARNGVWNFNTRKARASIEHITANRGYAFAWLL